MRRWFQSLLIAPIIGACHDGAQAPVRRPADLQVVTDLPSSGGVGAEAGSFVVRVTDADGQPVQGALVRFAPAVGATRVEPARDSKDGDGLAMTVVTLSTTPGPNQVE